MCLKLLNLIVTVAGAYSGCCYCTSRGEYSPALTKMVYLEHRRFLPANHPLRKERVGFPTNKVPKPLPKAKDMCFIKNANSQFEKAVSIKEKKSISRSTEYKGPYVLQTLSHHDRYLNTPVEPMHLIKNIVEHIVILVSGAEDSHKVRKEEKSRGQFSGTWMAHKKNQLPPAPFRLTSDEVKVANHRACSSQVPKGFG